MNPTRIVSLAIAAVALLGVIGVSAFGGRFSNRTDEAVEAAPAAAPTESRPLAGGEPEEPVAEEPAEWEGWGEDSEDSPAEDDDGAPAPVVVAPAGPPPAPSTSDVDPPAPVVLR